MNVGHLLCMLLAIYVIYVMCYGWVCAVYHIRLISRLSLFGRWDPFFLSGVHIDSFIDGSGLVWCLMNGLCS